MSSLGDNIKVHFAGPDNDMTAYAGLMTAGVKYNLYSCYPFIVSKKEDDDFEMGERIKPLKQNQSYMNHIIQDSGLFTLMFGAKKGETQTKESLTIWQNKLIKFVKQNKLDCTCVEIDCQKVLGVKEAWYFRERMRKLLPNKQMNVFHLEDGLDGLDALIDFSEYIAFSIPELRIARPKTFRQLTRKLVTHTKNRKPEIDIHLLGCTDKVMLQQNTECTSSDSTSWISGLRYGTICGKHISTVKKQFMQECRQDTIKTYKKLNIDYNEKEIERATNFTCCARIQKSRYEKLAGNQN